MINLVKPGHVLRFGTCPSTIISPPATKSSDQDNTLATLWPMASHLGLVECISHPSGPIGAIAAEAAKGFRAGLSISRSASYSAVGRALTAANRIVGSENCDFVGYVDGRSNYIQSAGTVFSKDFSGCLMVAYTLNGHRHVAHAAASLVPNMDCKQAFLTTIHNGGAQLIGWFRPYVDAVDGTQKIQIVTLMMNRGYINNPDKLTTFGVVTAGNQAYSIDAFKPHGLAGNDWVVTAVRAKQMDHGWQFH